jgi:ribonuclease P protein component
MSCQAGPMHDERFGPERRVKKRKDFLRIQDRGNKVRSRHLLLSVAPRAAGGNSRLGITVTKKIDKLAVVRNRLKRRLRELFRKNRHQVAEGFDLVAIALTGAPELSYAELESELRFILKKAGLLRRKSP